MEASPIKVLLAEEEPSRKATLKVIFLLSWPVIVEQMMITMVQYIDTAMVGVLGKNATSAVGLTASSIWLFNGILAAVAVGFSVQVAQYVGAGKTERAKAVVRQGILFNLCFGLLMAVLAVALSFPLPRWLGAEAVIWADASRYFRIIGVSMPFLLASTLLSSMIRCAGDTKTPMVLNLMINALNILFNFLLIYPTRTVSFGDYSVTIWGAGLGVVGAAGGSLIAVFVVSLLLLLCIYRKESPIQLTLKGDYRLRSECLFLAAKLGIPAAMERTVLCIAQIVGTIIVARLGTVAIAANHLAVTAEALSYLPASGLAMAATTLVGQAIGAGKKELAVNFSRMITVMGMVFMSCTGVLLYIFAPFLIGIFTPDKAVIALGARVLRIEAFAQPLYAASIVATGALRGAGDSAYPFLINLVSMWGVRITLALFLAPKLGLIGVWIAMCAELCVRGAVFLARLWRNKWLDCGIVGHKR